MTWKNAPGGIRAVTHGGQLLFAVRAFPACDLERRHDALADVDVLDVWANAIDDPHELRGVQFPTSQG
jgi:hypothetical protein